MPVHIDVRQSWEVVIGAFDLLAKLSTTDVDDGVVLFARAIGKDEASMTWLQSYVDRMLAENPNGPIGGWAVPDRLQMPERAQGCAELAAFGGATGILDQFFKWLPVVIEIIQRIREASGR